MNAEAVDDDELFGDAGGGHGKLVTWCAHSFDEALVEFLGGVVAEVFEFLVERGDFDEPGDVAAGADRQDDVRNFDAEYRVGLLQDAGAIHFFELAPFHERDHEVEPFLGANAGDAEDGRHVDDADAANFHVIAGRFG